MNLMNLFFSFISSAIVFWNEPKTPWWKVVFRREPRSQQVVANTYDDNVET
jgi:hypothetical protein